jgi:hypothetical protein
MKFSISIILHVVLLVIINGSQLGTVQGDQGEHSFCQDNSLPTLLKTRKKYIKDSKIKDNQDILLPACAEQFLNDFTNHKLDDRKLKVELSASLWEKINMVLLGKGPSNKKFIDQSTKLYFEPCGEHKKTQSRTTILDVLYSITYIETLGSMNLDSLKDHSHGKYENKNIEEEFTQLKESMLNQDQDGATEHFNKFFTEQNNRIKPIINIFENAPSIISFNDLEDILKRIACLGGLGALFFYGISKLAKEKMAEKIINYLDIRNIYIRSGFALLGVVVGIELASRWLRSNVSSKIENRITKEEIENIIQKYNDTIQDAKKIVEGAQNNLKERYFAGTS